MFKNIDLAQKIILGAGGALLIAVISYFYVSYYGEKETPDQIESSNYDVAAELEKTENLDPFEKDLLSTLRDKNNYERDKENDQRRYGVDGEFFNDEFSINPKEDTLSKADSIPEEQEIIEPEKPKVRVVYVEKPVPQKDPAPDPEPKTVRTREKRKMVELTQLGTSGPGSTATSLHVQAEVTEDQLIEPGAVVWMVLNENVNYKGLSLKRGDYFSGTVSNSGQRYDIEISSIGNESLIERVRVRVFDGYDKQEGLPAQSSEVRNMKRGAINDAIDKGADILDIDVAKNLTSGTQRMVDSDEVKILSGHKIILVFDEI